LGDGLRTLLASEFEHPNLNQTFSLWASKKIFGDFTGFGPCCTLGVFDGADLAAVVVYHNYQKSAGVVELSTASTTKRWLTRSVLSQMFESAFDGLMCQLVVIRVPETSHMRPMLRSYGFRCYEIPNLRGRGQSEFLHTLTDNEWRDRGGVTRRYRFSSRH
jgi:hypothetical protein